MVLTRSSRCETRSSAKKKALLDDSPKKTVHRPQAKKSTPVAADVKRITSKTSKFRVTRGLKRKLDLQAQTEEITNNNVKNLKDAVPTSEESNVETDDNVPQDASCSQSVEFYATPHYESSLSERAQGNPFIKILVREYDEVSSVNIKLKNDHLKSKIRPEIVQAFQLLSKDSEYYRYLDEDRELANLSIMPKQLIKDFHDKFDEFRKEALEDAQCRSNRLRPRGEKINYSILNGSKRKFLMDFRDDISRSGSNISNNGSWKGKMKKRQRKRLEMKTHIDLTKETCHCGKCEDCLRADDAETDGCEMSDSGTANTKHSIEIKSETKFSPIERRRRNCSNNMINWKYCYDISSDLKKGVKRVKTSDTNEVTPLKRLKTYPPDREKPAPKLTCKLSRENSPAPKETKDIKKKIKTEGKHIESNNGSVEKMKEKVIIKKEVKGSEEKDSSKPKAVISVDRTQDSDETPKSPPKKVHHENRNSIPATQNDEAEPSDPHKDKLYTNKIIDPKEILRGHIKKVVIDEQKIKIYGTPLTAELTEINNDQFYRLVVVLQGTDFIVKNAAMKNIRGPNETISQLYNCTVCHKDEIEEQHDNSKSHGSSTLSPKIERKEGIKLKSHVDSQKLPQIRPKVSNHLTNTIKHEPSSYSMEKLQRRNRAKMIPKTQPHIVPRVQPQLAPKPVSKVLPVPQYEVQTPRVPPIIFPNHMKSAVSSECNISTNTISNSSASETVGQTSGRVVVKATCFQRRPTKIEMLDSGSEDSDNLALDPDLKDRIISDITQAGKSIPDSRGLREALKRMGRRKTDPDIHPITRRMNKKVVRKMYTGNESLPNILKRTMAAGPSGGTGIGSSPGSPIRPQAQITNSPTVSNTNRPVSYKPFSSSTNSPQKVQLDNRGRYLDPYKPVERLEETPATALTASERLKLQKIDVAKKGSSVNPPEPTSTSTTIPNAIKLSATKKEAESADESDFELGESTQPPIKAVVCATSTTVATSSTPTVSKVSPPSGPVHIKILPKPDGAATVRSVNISGKPGLHDKIGYRKILPRPDPSSSSPSPQNTSPPKASVVTVSNLEATQDISNIQRRTTVDAEDSSSISPVKQQEREMLLLKSILRQKSPTTGNETIVVKQGKCETTQGRATITAVTAGSLRVPPASSYTTATATAVTTQTVKSPTPMRPITIRMTRVKNQPTLGSGSVNGVVVDVQNKEGCEKNSATQAN